MKMVMENGMKLAGLIAFGVIAAQPAAAATLVQYEFNGLPGNETSVAASSVAAGLSGLAFTENMVTPTSGTDSINASGWNRVNAYFTFGFNVTSGYNATINQLTLATRSSGTGPGFLSVLASIDGGAFTTVGSIVDTGTDYSNAMLAISPITAASSLVFRIVAANQTSANGGSVATAGTLRVTDYESAGTTTPVSLIGTITKLSATAVPEPGTWGMMLLGLGATGGFARRRRAITTRIAFA